MRVELVRIGNSRGVRIPKAVIEQCGLGDTVDLRVEDERLVIARAPAPREGWEEAFRAAGASDEDERLMEGGPPNRFDHEEWEW
jgi:antitoxin MazE